MLTISQHRMQHCFHAKTTHCGVWCSRNLSSGERATIWNTKNRLEPGFRFRCMVFRLLGVFSRRQDMCTDIWVSTTKEIMTDFMVSVMLWSSNRTSYSTERVRNQKENIKSYINFRPFLRTIQILNTKIKKFDVNFHWQLAGGTLHIWSEWVKKYLHFFKIPNI